MDLNASTARVKAGYLAQVYDSMSDTIVWESKKAYRTNNKAIKAAGKRMEKAANDLFSK